MVFKYDFGNTDHVSFVILLPGLCIRVTSFVSKKQKENPQNFNVRLNLSRLLVKASHVAISFSAQNIPVVIISVNFECWMKAPFLWSDWKAKKAFQKSIGDLVQGGKIRWLFQNFVSLLVWEQSFEWDIRTSWLYITFSVLYKTFV